MWWVRHLYDIPSLWSLLWSTLLKWLSMNSPRVINNDRACSKSGGGCHKTGITNCQVGQHADCFLKESKSVFRISCQSGQFTNLLRMKSHAASINMLSLKTMSMFTMWKKHCPLIHFNEMSKDQDAMQHHPTTHRFATRYRQQLTAGTRLWNVKERTQQDFIQF